MSSSKVHKCHYCKKFHHELIQLPFNNYICPECIDLKSANDIQPSPIDSMNPLSVYLGRIDSHYKQMQSLRPVNSSSSSSSSLRHAKLYKFKTKLDAYGHDIVNYPSRIRRIVDATRFEVDMHYEVAKSRVEKRLFEQTNWVNLQAEESSQNYALHSKRILSSVESSVAYLKTVEFESEAHFRQYESQLQRELFIFEMQLNGDKFLRAKETMTSRKITIGKLEPWQIEKKVTTIIFNCMLRVLLSNYFINYNVFKTCFYFLIRPTVPDIAF
jgi:hypothetical protein